jgi:hypothetical protein
MVNGARMIVTDSPSDSTSRPACSIWMPLHRVLTGGWGVVQAAREGLNNQSSHALKSLDFQILDFVRWTSKFQPFLRPF